jgi:hypothetical protein
MNGSTDGYPAFAVANSVTSFQAYGMGTYCFFSTNSSMISANAYTSPNVSGVGWHGLVTVSIAGTGTIQNIINNTGGAANSGNNVAKLSNYP